MTRTMLIRSILYLTVVLMCQCGGISSGAGSSPGYQIQHDYFSSINGGSASSGYRMSGTLAQFTAALDAKSSGYGALAVPPLPSLAPCSSSVSNATVGVVYSFMTSGTNATRYTIGNKPSWASFDGTTGTLTGTPTIADLGTNANIVISASNSTGSVSLPPFAITVRLPMPTISGTPATTATIGASYSFTSTATNAASFNITGSIPPGLSFNSASGTLSGTPTTVGTYGNIVLSATNSTGTVSLPAFAISVASTTPGPPTGVFAIAGNAHATVSFSVPASTGGSAITSFSVTASPGNLIASGAATPITVTGLTNGTSYTFTVTATNNAGKGPASAPSPSVVPLAIPPVLTISTIADRASTNNPVLNISGSVTSTLDSISTLTLNGTSVACDPTDGSFTSSLPLITGDNTVTLIATDSAGLATSVTRTVTLNSTLPAFTISAPADNSTVEASFLDVTGTADANVTVVVTANGVAAQSVNRNGATFTSTVNLVAGMNTIEVAADAASGAVNTVKRTVFSKSSQSLVAVTNPAQDILNTTGACQLQGMASNPLYPVTVTITANGVSYPQSLTNGAFSQQLSFPTVQTYPIVVTATDSNGISTTVQRDIIYAGYPSGDINGDGIVTVSDALMALRLAVGLIHMDDMYLVNGDVAPLVNGKPGHDNKIDVSDALMILKKCVGLVAW